MTLPSFRLDDQVALVTGASSGIGRAIALGLAEAGAAVGCLDRGDVAGTVDEITTGGGRACALSADVTDATSKSLAMEWADRGIRVNVISPGYTATPMNTRPEVAEQVKRFEADTPLGRMATPEEMVGPAVLLLSEAASFVTGIDLIVDGGFVCW